MSKTLIAYFSTGGTTAGIAGRMASAKKTDLFEIVPKIPYSKADLDYTDPNSRCMLEMQDESCRPEILNVCPDIAQYDTIILGFPIWGGKEPPIIDSFLEAYDLAGKTVIPFCSSAVSLSTDACLHIRSILNGKAAVENGGRLISEVQDEDLAIWPEFPPVREEEKELVQAFHMMWDNYPERVRLIDRKFRILAGNKAYIAGGGLTNVPCNIGNPELHKGCLAMACLKSQETRIKTSMVDGVRWDSYWMPVCGYDDYYVHFTNGLNETIAKRMKK